MKIYKPDQSLINRLLMKLDPNFSSLTEKEQNRSRQHFIYNDSKAVYTYLYQALFGFKYDEETDDEQLLSSEQTHLLNAHTTALVGIGNNAFRLCELQGSDFDLSSFDSLYYYDVAEFEFQQQARKKDFPGSYEEREYRLYLNNDWVRLLDAEKSFYYSTLSSLSSYLAAELDDTLNGIIQSLIPYELAEGRDHGKNVNGGMLWDFAYQANGLEAQLEELQSRAYCYISDARKQLDDEFCASESGAVYFDKYSDDMDGPCWNVIIKNAETAKRITFAHFLEDCQKQLKSNETLITLKAREKEKMEDFLQLAHKDILTNFDPKVVKLKKKRKIVMSPGALDDLSNLSDEE